jgi:predicted DNA-binding transcriptional regulator YafY
VEALSVSGIPVYALTGRGGGIAISENYTLDKTVLSEEERLELVSSVKALDSLSGGTTGEKLSRLVPSNTDWLEVDFSPWSPEGQGVRQLFGTLRECILKKRQVEFDYFGGSGKTERRSVHPWKLVYRGQAWYLLGWCNTRKAERYFKLSRMVNVEQTGRVANVMMNETRQTENAGSKPDKNPRLIKIKAKISANKAFYLLDSFACSETKTGSDGSLIVTFTAPDSDWLIGNLLSYGADLKIISPKKIRDAVIKEAIGVTELYKTI